MKHEDSSPPASTKVLFVDDKADILEQGKIFLEKKEKRLKIDTAASAAEGPENAGRGRV